MDIKTLTKYMNDFVLSKGWYGKDSPREQSARNLAISLSLEASEVLEHFQWSDNFDNKNELANELADVSLYLLQIAAVTGIDLEAAILKKLTINTQRDWDKVS